METITIRVQVTAPDAPTAELEAIRAACEAGPHESASRAVERVLFDRHLSARAGGRDTGDLRTVKWAGRVLDFVNENFDGDPRGSGEDPDLLIIRLLIDLLGHRGASK